jgi:hypothetical protein
MRVLNGWGAVMTLRSRSPPEQRAAAAALKFMQQTGGDEAEVWCIASLCLGLLLSKAELRFDIWRKIYLYGGRRGRVRVE